MEYYIGEVRVSKQEFLKIKQQLEMSNHDWEIDYGIAHGANYAAIVIFG